MITPSELVFHGLYRTEIVHPALSDLDEHRLGARSTYSLDQVVQHVSEREQLDIVRKASILLRLHLDKKVIDADPDWIAQALRRLASNPDSPPTAVELRFICQAFSHLADRLDQVEHPPWHLLVDSLEFALSAPFPEGAGRANWCQSMLRKIVNKRGLEVGITNQLFPLVDEIYGRAQDGSLLERDCEKTRKHLRYSDLETFESEVEAMETSIQHPDSSETLEQLQRLITRDPECLGRLQHFMGDELGRQIKADVALKSKDKKELMNRLKDLTQ